MCGFPLMHLDKYLKVLVQQHKRPVAICEEFRKNREGASLLAKPTFERRVVRILTPGTLIDESFLNPFENNYLLAISSRSEGVSSSSNSTAETCSFGLAWIDVSTGEFFSRDTSAASLKDHLVRISPREVVLSNNMPNNTARVVEEAIAEVGCPTSLVSEPGDRNVGNLESTDFVDDVVNTITPDSDVFSTSEQNAISILNSFLKSNLMEHAPSTLRPLREGKSQRMQIDGHTLKALEIHEGMREGGAIGSLMSTVKRTVTSSGTRLLSRWLCK
jgi:DNA mismatch repair ATPase MutS